MEHSAAEVKEGVDLAAEAGSALEAILAAVRKNIELLEEIVQGARQASEGTQQLSASNEQVTSTIQQAASSTQQLAEIAGRLQSSIDSSSNAATVIQQHYYFVTKTLKNSTVNRLKLAYNLHKFLVGGVNRVLKLI